MKRDDYCNGFRFGRAYALNHGLDALLRAIRTRRAVLDKNNGACLAGVVDAALAMVQEGVK
jgi:hypothetical protein